MEIAVERALASAVEFQDCPAALHMRFCKWHAPKKSKRGEFTRTNAATPAKVVQFTYFAGSKPKLTSANNTGKTAVFNV